MRPSIKQVHAAINTLEAYGRSCFRKPEEVTRGTAVGHALNVVLEGRGLGDLAAELFEQGNYHETAAIIRCLHHGKGRFRRNGNRVSIILPAYWRRVK
jgi:hypothetical protein